MNPKRVIWAMTAAAILTSVPVGTARTQATQHPGQHGNATFGPDRGPLPAAVRRATEQFLDVTAAIAAGYVENGGCVSGPEEGAMGVHYAKFALFDATVDVEEPEVLVYEPRRGRLHLVAAEYVTPAAAGIRQTRPRHPS